MAVSLLTNTIAMTAQRHLEENNTIAARAEERLASGKRINHPSDDAAGLAISESLEAQARSTAQARRNTVDAMGFLQVAEGGMNECGNLLIRLRELAVQAASDTVSDRERGYLMEEAKQNLAEVTRLASTVRYGNVPLLNGEARELVFQVGPDNNSDNRITFAAGESDLRADALGVDGIDLSDADSARDAISSLDDALGRVDMPRAKLGAMQSRLETITRELYSREEAISGAVSRIRDCDYAQEVSVAARARILQQASVAVLVQANSEPALALRLIGG